MPHYRDGTPTQVGDVVKGTGYNLKNPDGTKREFVGQVVGVVPGSEACNIQVAYIETAPLTVAPPGYFFKQAENTVIGCGAEGGGGKAPKILARVGLEYGQCDAFEKIG